MWALQLATGLLRAQDLETVPSRELEPDIAEESLPPGELPSADSWLSDETPYPEAAYPEVESSGRWLRSGLWYFGAEAVLLNRDTYQDLCLSTDLSSGRSLVIDRREPDFVTSTRLTLGQVRFRDEFGSDHALEFTYFGLGNWHESGELQALRDNSIVSCLDATVGGFNFADTQAFDYDAQFNSFEFNYRIRQRLGRDQLVLQPDGAWRQRLAPGRLLSWLAGVRIVQIDERLLYTSAATDSALRNGSLLVSTDNTLVGFQIGGEYAHQAQYWSLGVEGRAGPYVNFGARDLTVSITDPVLTNIDRSEHKTDESIAFVGQLSLFARYHFRPNLYFRAGYELLWLNSLLLAPEQIEFLPSSENGLSFSGAQFYQGLSLGAELSW